MDWEPSELVPAVAVISGKWKMKIICLLFGGTKRFGELRRSLAGVHRGTLTYELRRLEADGIIQRTQYLTIPPIVEYTLTSQGNALKPSNYCIVEMDSGRQGNPFSFIAREELNRHVAICCRFACFRVQRGP